MKTRSSKKTSTVRTTAGSEKPKAGILNCDEEHEQIQTEEDQLSFKYYQLYESLNDTFHLVSDILEKKHQIKRTAEEIAVKLHRDGKVSDDQLYNYFPHLEPKSRPSKSNSRFKNGRSENQWNELANRVIESSPDAASIFRWLSRKLEEANFAKEFHEMCMDENSSTDATFEIVPLDDVEWKYNKNRWVIRMFECMQFVPSGQETNKMWGIPKEVKAAQLAKYLTMLKVAERRAEEVNKANKLTRTSNGTASSKVNQAHDAKSKTEAPIIKRLPLVPRNVNMDDLDEIFSSPQHKKTKSFQT